MANKERNINNILSNKLVLFNTFFGADWIVTIPTAAGARSATLFNDPIRWSNVSFLLCVGQTQRENRNSFQMAGIIINIEKVPERMAEINFGK